MRRRKIQTKGRKTSLLPNNQTLCSMNNLFIVICYRGDRILWLSILTSICSLGKLFIVSINCVSVRLWVACLCRLLLLLLLWHLFRIFVCIVLFFILSCTWLLLLLFFFLFSDWTMAFVNAFNEVTTIFLNSGIYLRFASKVL